MIAVAIVGLAFVPFLQRLPAPTRVLFLAAGAIYIGGAIGAEMLGASARTYLGPGSIAASMNVLEEVGELFGVLLLIHAVLALGLSSRGTSEIG